MSNSKKSSKKRKTSTIRRDIGNEQGVIIILRKDFKKLIAYTMFFLEGTINSSDAELSQGARQLAPYVASIWDRVKLEDINPEHIMTVIKIIGEEGRRKLDKLMSNSNSYTIGVSEQIFEMLNLAGKEIKKEKTK